MTETDYLKLYEHIPMGTAVHYLRTPEGKEMLGVGVAEQRDADTLSSWRNDLSLPDDGLAFFYISFDPAAARQQTWRPFGDARVVVPSVLFERVGDSARVHALGGPEAAVLLNELRELPATPAQELASDSTADRPLPTQDKPYETAVRVALKALKDSDLLKVVVAREETFTMADPVNIAATLRAMNERFPECTTFAIRPSDSSLTFIGVTPERLVQVKDGVASTGALAGSAPRGDDQEADHQLATQLAQSPKDKEEHEFVRDMIQEALQPVSKSVDSGKTTVLKLKNVQHLWTSIEANLKDDVELLDLVDRLHPTPAVGGVPRALARREIARIEDFDRGLYAGVVGYFDQKGAGDAFVSIRSALINGADVHAYAGAGIVADSEPQREAQETSIKFAAVLEALR